MADQLANNRGATTGSTSTAGAIFGIDRDVANAPLMLSRTSSTTDTTRSQRPNLLPTMGTVLQALSRFYAMNPETKKDVIAQLQAANYLTAGKHTNSQVFTAYKNAVVDASRGRRTVSETIAEGIATSDAVGGATKDPLRATNPADLAAIAQEVAVKRLGRGLTDEETQRLTSGMAAFEAPYLAADGAVAPPGAGAFQMEAQKLLRDMAPVEAGANDLLGVVDTLSKLFGGES